MAIRSAEVAVLITLVILWHVPIPRAKDRLPTEPEGATEAAIKRGGNGPRMLVRLWHNRNGKRRAACAERIVQRVIRFEGIANAVESVGIWTMRCPLTAALAGTGTHNEGACKPDAVKGTGMAVKAGDDCSVAAPVTLMRRKKSHRSVSVALIGSCSSTPKETGSRSRHGPA